MKLRRRSLRVWLQQVVGAGHAVAALAVILAGTLATSLASAEKSPVSFGVGVLGTVNGNFFTEPGDKTISANSNAQASIYPGFVGVSPGFGFMTDVRYREFIGLEVDLIHSSDYGTGDLNSYQLKIGQSAWHLPVLLKAVLPLGLVQPFVVLGPEIVFPGEATAEYNYPGFVTTLSAQADTYWLLAFGAGLEIKLPLPIDLRIPISLRGGINPKTSDSLSERTNVELQGIGIKSIRYNTEWQYRASAMVGAAIHF